MEKLKNFFRITATNKMMWITLIIGVTIIISTTGIVCGISYMRNKTNLASANTQESDNIMNQEDLVDTSKMSEEELKKLNDEEVEKAKKKEEEENKKKGKKTNTTPTYNYYIKINYQAQVVTIYKKDKNGKYTIPVRACVCSTGAATPTSGVYRLSWKTTWGKLFGNVWGQYCSQVVGDILIHSVPYNQPRKDTLINTYYDRLGTKDSMGCIRLTTIDAQWIYYNCPSGTQVEFYASSNPGPLGKPVAKKISNAPGILKHWDPTDPDPKNPWRTYKPTDDKNTQKPSTGNNEVQGETTPPTVNNETQGGTTTPSTGNNETQGGTTTPSTGNNETQSGTTTPPTGNNETQGGETTPSTGNNETQGETTPSTGNNETQGGTTPSTSNNEIQGETTTSPTVNNEISE